LRRLIPPVLTRTRKCGVVHEPGFGGASVRAVIRAIARAAGVPQSSFTNHFACKEACGLEVIDLYFADATELMRRTPRNDDLPPLQRLRGVQRLRRPDPAGQGAAQPGAAGALRGRAVRRLAQARRPGRAGGLSARSAESRPP
jgi:AcrR family transcriptional regulator